MKDKLINLAGAIAILAFLGLLADGAKSSMAQNMSQMGMAYSSKKAIREAEILRCMRLPEIADVRRCVETIK